jgi:hypothetical protein
MKKLVPIIFLGFLAFACSSDKSSQDPAPVETQEPSADATDGQLLTPPSDPNATPNDPARPTTVDVPAGADGVVHHYVCPDKCEGGFGDASGPCPGCGLTMAHNTAYHAAQNAQQQPNINITNQDGQDLQVNQGTPPVGNQVVSPLFKDQANAANLIQQKPEPAQNASGVWHYTCPKGCAGGGGSAVACSSCGTTLVHNSAYHQ